MHIYIYIFIFINKKKKIKTSLISCYLILEIFLLMLQISIVAIIKKRLFKMIIPKSY
jgi:hypothetical protein